MAASTHDNILFFTDRGRVFQTKVYEIPVGSRTAKGKPIQNFLEIPTDENVNAVIAYGNPATPEGKKELDSKFLVMATKNGVIKKTPLADFQNVRRNGIICIKLKKNDLLKWAKLSTGKDEIVISTEKGQAIRFKESQVRPMGRAASGVRAIRLKKDDAVSSMDLVEPQNAKAQKLLVIMANGFGKQTPIAKYRLQNRGGSGIKTAKITAKTGPIVAAQVIDEEEDILAISAKGQIIRTTINTVRVAGRATQGVKIMSLNAGDKVAGIICI